MGKMNNARMVLVDGSYYLFRAYHAIPGLSNKNGEPTGAIYGVINMIRGHLTEGGPDYFAVIFDAKGKTFRHKIYEGYKANRPPIPDDLACQIQPLQDIIRALGIPLLIIDNVEADDVIASLSHRAMEKGIKTIISTGDKDLAQIVNGHVHLINTMNNNYLDREGVIKKFGVPPERIVDYLALMGDSVDNIPGVPKVGPKTAVKWLTEYGSLNNVIANAENIKGKVGENLRAHLPYFPIARQLVTLKYDVETDCLPEDLVIETPDKAALRKLYTYWNFNSWRAQLDSIEKTPAGITDDPEYKTILNEAQLDKWIDKLRQAPLISIDTETTSLDYMEAEVVGLSFAVSENEAAYLPLRHDYADAPEQLDLETTLKKLKPLIEDENLPKAGQNLKYDLEVFANYGIQLNGIKHDTMLESYVIDSNAVRHNMDSLAKYYLGLETTRYEDVAGKGARQIPFGQVNIETATKYAAEDADVVLKLHRVLSAKLDKTATLKEVYQTIEMPLLTVLANMERHGVTIDAMALMQQDQELKSDMRKVREKVMALAGEPFNIDSPKQLQTILYDQMKLPVLSKTPKGQPSTAESVLTELAEKYELPKLILDYRSMSKLSSTYTEKLPRMINRRTGRIHTSYHQAVASTGRLSSSAPNLQNIPTRTATGRKIRQAFIAPESYSLVAADYSQIELRIMAHLSGDKSLLTAFAEGLDIHRKTAAEVFSVSLDEVNAQQRRTAKAINFGLIYGMSAFGLARQLSISRIEAQKYVKRYFERYPGVKRYMEETCARAKDNGYVETVYGRRLYLADIKSKNAARRQYAERTAINAPMQGTAADIIKLAMINIDRWLQHHDIDAKMIMQVHDELVFEVKTDSLDVFIREIETRMNSNDRLSVPLEVDIGHGANWDAAH